MITVVEIKIIKSEPLYLGRDDVVIKYELEINMNHTIEGEYKTTESKIENKTISDLEEEIKEGLKDGLK